MILNVPFKDIDTINIEEYQEFKVQFKDIGIIETNDDDNDENHDDNN